MYWVSGSRSSAVGTNGASAIASREVIRELARADGRLRGLVRLCEFLLNVVSPHVGERYNHGFVKAEGRQPWIDVIVLLVCIYQRAQVDDLVFSESGGMIHTRPVSVGLSLVTQSFREAGRLSRRRAANRKSVTNLARLRLNNPL